MFDLTRKETFEHIPEWLVNIKDNCGDEVHFVLVGNKCDLEKQVDDTDIDVMFSNSFLNCVNWILILSNVWISNISMTNVVGRVSC